MVIDLQAGSSSSPLVSKHFLETKASVCAGHQKYANYVYVCEDKYVLISKQWF